MNERRLFALLFAVSSLVACSDSGPVPAAPPATSADAGPDSRTAAEVPADPARWRKTSALATARLGHTATVLRDGRVLVVGGETASQSMLASTELFDPSTETWTEGPKLPSPRSNHVALLLNDGRVLVAGGGKSTPTGQPMGEKVTAESLLFDPATNTFAPTGALAEGRSHLQAVLLASGKVLVAGGGTSAQSSPADCHNAPYCGPFAVPTAKAETFDPTTGAWANAGEMTTARNSFALSALPGGRVLATGGVDAEAVGFRSAEIFDETKNEWVAVPDMNGPPREHHTAATAGTGRVLVIGGKNPNVTPLASTLVFDHEKSAWTDGPALGEARTAAGATALASGRILLTGGFAQLASNRGKPGALAETSIYDDATGKLTKLAPLADGRVRHATVLLANGSVLVVGGAGEDVTLASCEIGEP